MTSWIIKSKNLDFHFDNPGFSTCFVQSKLKILDYQTENPSFSDLPMSNNLKNLDFRVENLGLSSDNPSFSITYRKSWIINWKSKFFLKILDYQLKILDFRPIIQDVGRKSKIFDLLDIEPTIGVPMGDFGVTYFNNAPNMLSCMSRYSLCR